MQQVTSQCDETVDKLRKEVNRLNKENTNLVKQLNRIGSEYEKIKLQLLELQNADVSNCNVVLDADVEFSDLEKLCHIQILEHFADIECIPDACVNEPFSTVSNEVQDVSVDSPVTYKQNKCSKQVKNVSTKNNVRIQDEPKTIVIGTSLVKDVLLRQAGVNGYTVCYPGQYVPYIRSRIHNLLESEDVDYVYIQCAGNDLERYPGHLVVQQYELLIQEIKYYLPNAEILIGSVPPRRRNPVLLDKIRKFNTYLSNRGKQNDNVTFVHAAPTQREHFKRDNTHFNDHGTAIFIANIVNKVRYLHSFPALQRSNYH
jgi:hypothetical protein